MAAGDKLAAGAWTGDLRIGRIWAAQEPAGCTRDQQLRMLAAAHLTGGGREMQGFQGLEGYKGSKVSGGDIDFFLRAEPWHKCAFFVLFSFFIFLYFSLALIIPRSGFSVWIRNNYSRQAVAQLSLMSRQILLCCCYSFVA